MDKLYKIEGQPTVVFFNRGHDINRISLGQNFEAALTECERILQTVLRMGDRGLPLPIVAPYIASGPVDTTRTVIANIQREGNWGAAEGAIFTEDPKAVLIAHFEGKSLRMIATLHPQARDACKLHVTLNDKPIPQNICGIHLKHDDKGNSVVEVNRNSGVYELIHTPTSMKGVIKIHFISVIENPAIFYELRAAN